MASKANAISVLSRVLAILGALAFLVGCNSTYLYDEPRFTTRLKKYSYDYEPNFDACHTFAAVPSSALTQQPADSDERKILYSVVRELRSRGYHYSTDLDSLDFIVTAKLSDEIQTNDYPHVTFLPPALENIQPYILNPLDSVRERVSRKRLPTRLELFVYDVRSSECAGQFVGAAIDSDFSRVAIAEKMLPTLVEYRLSENLEINLWDSVLGPGSAGFAVKISRADYPHIFPEIVSITINSAAGHSRLKLGDLLTNLDGESLDGISYVDFYKRMKGDVGRRITLEALRGKRLIRDTLVYERRIR
ncbi:MAG: hypothetical protein Q8922_10515 [Bacteroidota bacterium]|nr:hypothetical protein [Bacteroidota bacterium]MDP4234565.1 hypothetical protein [Bacteroidota bacterium]MDP4243694.1 hypothetical protein [Bacteroidota bacterium]MDP4288358.1 hypothetical protein [Bacteroidota bacterium]